VEGKRCRGGGGVWGEGGLGGKGRWGGRVKRRVYKVKVGGRKERISKRK
jgi:hypothetical protein